MVFYAIETGHYETPKQGLAREDIWEWLKTSLKGGPMEYLIRKCPIHGDGHWIYEHIKQESNAPTVITHSRLVGKFFNQQRDATNLNAAKLKLEEDADHIEEISRVVGMKPFLLPGPIRRSLVMDIALPTTQRVVGEGPSTKSPLSRTISLQTK